MIIISPYSKRMRNGKRNPKNYPWWPEVIRDLKEEVIQVGVGDEERFAGCVHVFDKPLEELERLISKCRIWVSVELS